LRTGCCGRSVVSGSNGYEKEGKEWGRGQVERGSRGTTHETVNAQSVFRVSEGPEADAHARLRRGWERQKEWKSAGGSVT
jgi:hypothetical protein